MTEETAGLAVGFVLERVANGRLAWRWAGVELTIGLAAHRR